MKRLAFSLILVVQLASPALAQSAPPMSIAQAEELAEQNSVELRLLRGERVLAHEAERARWRDFLPQVSLSYRRNRTVAQRNFDNGAHSVQLSVSQPIFDGGRSVLALEIAQLDARMAQERYAEAQVQLRLKVRESYLRILQDQEGVLIARGSLESAHRALQRAELELQQGAIAALDERQLASEFERRALDLERQDQSAADGLSSFRRLLRLPDDDSLSLLRLEDLELRFPSPPPANEDLVELALERRSDVRQARIDALRAAREHRIQQYDWLPTVALTGNLGRTGEEWPPRTTEWGVGLSFTFRAFGNTLVTDAQEDRSRGETSRGYSSSATLNIYDNASWRESELRSEMNLYRARERQRDLMDEVRQQIESLRRDFLLRVRESELAANSLQVQAGRFQVDRLKYENGELALQEYLEQELRFIQAQHDLVKQRVDLALAANQMESALGLPLDSLGMVEIRMRQNAVSPLSAPAPASANDDASQVRP
ncbi:MAG: TolC family protein [Leptospirales bacterium]|nr:TolC family protein [Leptospirales bacterium]